MKTNLREFALWTRRVLLFLILAWGTFAAAVAFGIRYELGPFAYLGDPTIGLPPQDLQESFLRHGIILDDSASLLPPSEIARVFLAAFGASRDNADTAGAIDPARLSLDLVIHWADSAAVWKVEYRTGCDCPYTRPEERPRITAFIDPISGEVLGLIDQAFASPLSVRDTSAQPIGEGVLP